MLGSREENVRIKTHTHLLAFACGGILAVSAPAYAESTAVPAAEPPAGGGESEEIVVTALKREEALKDVPASVSVLAADELVKSGAFTFEDFAGQVPGLNFANAGGAGLNQVILRGISAGDQPSATVGIYVNDTPYGSSSSFASGGRLALDLALFDVDRIEVLRGPQGTIYGASSLGGLIKYVLRRPDSDTFSALFDGEVSSTRKGGVNRSLRAAINIPIASGLAGLRLSGYDDLDAGFVDNVLTGRKDINRGTIRGGRAALLLTPSAGLKLELGLVLQDISRDGFNASDVNPLTGVPTTGDLTQSRYLREGFDQKFRLVSGNLEWALGGASLVSATSWQQVKSKIRTDDSQIFGAMIGYPLLFSGPLKTEKFTQEVRLVSASNRPFEWILGGFYTNEKSRNYQKLTAEPSTGGEPPVGLNPLIEIELPTRFEEYAIFGDVTWRPARNLDFMFGARWSTNRQSYSQTSSGYIINGNVPGSEIVKTASSKDDVWTFLFTSRYRLEGDLMAYVRVANGYRPGGPNVVPPPDPVTGEQFAKPEFGPDRLWSYEAGMKGKIARSLEFDLATFYVDWSDIQINERRNGFSFRANGGKASSKGVEASLSWKPFTGLNVAANVAYTDSRLEDDVPSLGGVDGERLTYVPRWAGAINADYEFFFKSDIRINLGATLRYVGSRTSSFSANAERPPFTLAAYGLTDLRMVAARKNIEARLFVRNVFDRRGELGVDTSVFLPGSAGSAYMSYVQPRTFGLALSVKY